MEPNGIFFNRSFQLAATPPQMDSFEQKPTTKSYIILGSKDTLVPSEKNYARMVVDTMETSTSFSHSCSQHQGRGSKTECVKMVQSASQNLHFQQLYLRSSTSKRPLKIEESQNGSGHYANGPQEDDNNNECNNNNSDNNYSIGSTTSCSSTSVNVSPSTTKKFKSKSGVDSQERKEGDYETMEEDDGLFTLPTSSSSPTTTLATPSSPLTWKLPSFLCLPFTNNDANNSYLHLVNTSSKSSAGILSLSTLLLVVIAVLLASVPAPVMSAVRITSSRTFFLLLHNKNWLMQNSIEL